ncbi:cytochrome c biogenesis protein ResB [Allokutzneria oryzae]|uniref:Cytochrome c biogenesis protein ResB n=1 Tax=Allokutzneria oryzae TaxID=1378989 RepID=A0ABV5ZWF5_9PSEU
MTTDQKAPPMKQGPVAAGIAFLRNTWRGLTSMRTALILLFLLALAALPGALLPQRLTAGDKVGKFFDDNPNLAPVLNRLGLFDVFGSVWFSAIYVLLFISLVGCLVPRTVEYARQMRAKPVLTPRNLARMPHHAKSTVDTSAEDVVAAARTRLRGWRTEVRVEDDGSHTISAEKGFLREAGNLVFHFALMGMLVAIAFGKMFGFEGQVIIRAGDAQGFCNSGIYAYDSFRPGLRIDGTELTPFCMKVDDFTATFLHNGQADSFRANVSYQDVDDLETGTWRQAALEVNSPLRLTGGTVYLLGHGYAPRFTVTFPDGQKRTEATQWQTMNTVTLLSQGATKFDPPGVTDLEKRRTGQLAITGLFAPTAAFEGTLMSSVFPDLKDPAVAVDVMRGDLGNESGKGQSIFEIDKSMVDSGRLKKVARQNMRVGEEIVLDDGTRIHFDGVERWVGVQVGYDPGRLGVLVAGVLVLLGIGASLSIKRRRVWLRATPAPDGTENARTVVEVGGLARTDQAGYGEEFTTLAADLLRPGKER